MKLVTRDLPCTPVVHGIPTFLSFTGVDVGPLFVHRDHPDDRLELLDPRFLGWTVSHTATGYAVQKGIRTKAVALRMARQLRELGCWGFKDPGETKLIPADVMELIGGIRRSA